MSSQRAQLMLKPILLSKQVMSDTLLENMIHSVYNNIKFSTFPYLSYKLNSSTDAFKQYNSGNCIALCMYCQEYLLSNHGIKSHIIPASVPDAYKVEGTQHLCHVSLLIPLSLNEFYIFDPAFNNLSCMYCDCNNNRKRKISCCDIYNHTTFDIDYSLEICDNLHVDDAVNHVLLPKTISCSCCFTLEQNQKWNYYLVEVLNPDEAIGISFLKAKPQPFMLYTIYDEKANIVKMLYKLKLNEDGKLIITEYPSKKEIYSAEYDPDSDEFKSLFKHKNGHSHVFDKYLENYI